MQLKKFVWVGKNKHFNEYWVTPPMTTEDILKGNWQTFFSIENRKPNGNCEFLMEIFEGDNLIYHSKNSMSSMSVEIQNNEFVGVGPFNTHPLKVYFNAIDFESMEIEKR